MSQLQGFVPGDTESVLFDGCTDFDAVDEAYRLNNTGQGTSGHGKMCGSFWFKFTASSPVVPHTLGLMDESASGDRILAFFTYSVPNWKLILFGKIGGVTVFGHHSNIVMGINQWYHICFSLDLEDASAVNRVKEIWINDTDEYESSPLDLQVSNFQWARAANDWSIGRNPTATSGPFVGGQLAECWMDLTSTNWLDFSTTGNRRKFISATGQPVNLGSDGSAPTGTAPTFYFPDGNATTNAGGGSNFSVVSPDTAPDPC